jgi:hypothetical protein
LLKSFSLLIVCDLFSPNFVKTLYLKKKEKKKKDKTRAGDMAEVVESLPTKHRALSSNPNATAKKESRL